MTFRSLFLGTLFSLAAAPTLSAPVVFQEVPEIVELYKTPQTFCKSTPTMGRLPAPEMIGKEFPTYISDGKGGATLETTNTITDDVVIARMPKPVSGAIYNEWLIPKAFWQQTYGKLPTDTTIKPYYRVKPVRAIEITDTVLKLLGSTDDKSATIMIPWSPDGMTVHKGGYLAECEYAIAPEEMKANYSLAPAGVVDCGMWAEPVTEAPAGAKPTFNCRKARGVVENLICQQADLAMLDQQMATVYAEAMKRLPQDKLATQKAVQRGWIKGRNDCWKADNVAECTQRSYKIRIVELQMMSGQLEVPDAVDQAEI